jgi:hypothetical protein
MVVVDREGLGWTLTVDRTGLSCRADSGLRVVAGFLVLPGDGFTLMFSDVSGVLNKDILLPVTAVGMGLILESSSDRVWSIKSLCESEFGDDSSITSRGFIRSRTPRLLSCSGFLSREKSLTASFMNCSCFSWICCFISSGAAASICSRKRRTFSCIDVCEVSWMAERTTVFNLAFKASLLKNVTNFLFVEISGGELCVEISEPSLSVKISKPVLGEESCNPS